MSFLKDSFFKKLSIFFIFTFSIFLTFYLVKKGTTVHLPTRDRPIVFFNSQNQEDLKLTFIDAIQKAQHKIVLAIFTLKDPHLIAWLNKKVKQGVEVRVYYDAEHNKDLVSLIDERVALIPYQLRGLMHRKLLMIDDIFSIVGSANCTKSSLMEDDNLICGLYNEQLTLWLERHLTHYNIHASFYASSGEYTCFLNPDKKKEALHRLIQEIDSAKKCIKLAMYSFSHPEIIRALARAQERGVDLEIYLDKQMRFADYLKKQKGFEEIRRAVRFSKKPFLMHHKCALIDDETFIMGSTNWTQAGFMKNQDFLLIFHQLDSDLRSYLQMVFKTIGLAAS